MQVPRVCGSGKRYLEKADLVKIETELNGKELNFFFFFFFLVQ